jgi:PBSX family phage terminase large subunit
MEEIKLSEIITPKFWEFHEVFKKSLYTYYVLKGGRSSGKSTTAAIELILELVKNPITILCVRKVGNTLSESCYEQLKEAISMLGMDRYFKSNQSPLRITYKPRGNSIIFRGADDPAKIKSIKMSKFPITVLWIEELAEFKTEEEVSTIVLSILRAKLEGGLNYKIIYSYNPPKRRQSWVNKRFESILQPKHVYLHKSTYLDNPYISNDFILEAEHIKKVKPLKYRHEYLGEPIGSGVVPFDNLEFKELTDADIRNFDNIRMGLDWGYATDPLGCVRLHYDKTRRRIYIFDEIYRVKMSNREAAEEIKRRGWTDTRIICDSAEPKSIEEMRGYGLKCDGAKKGQGSVEYGEKWLDDLDAIIIDPKRCPNAAMEFENIDYDTDKDGNVLNRLVDKDNHLIDGCRYALTLDMRQSKFSFN